MCALMTHICMEGNRIYLMLNLPNMVPIVSPMVADIAPPVSESKLELNAQAQALVPEKESK